MKNKPKYYLLTLISLFVLLFSLSGYTQDKKQLQAKKIKLQKEIRQINNLLSKTKKDEKNLLSRLGDINKKIEIRQSLINTINKESLTFTKEINKNKKEIIVLENQLKVLKKELSNMVVQTYKTKIKQNKLLFLLSADNFSQAYKRMQYMKQYTNSRKEKAKIINHKKVKLQSLNDSLKIKRLAKELLIADEIEEKRSIDSEKIAQQKLINKVKKKERRYTAQIRAKQKSERAFNKQLENLIKGVITKSTSSSNTSSGFKLTPQAEKLASSFVASKGKLPHPVQKGYVSRYFGERPHEELKKIKVKSVGWHYITEKNAKARSVYKGSVLAIQVDKKTKLKTVLLQHGNYFTTYKNLTTLFVEKGDQVNSKEDLGVIHTDKTTGKTKLVFALWKNAIPQNPTSWLKK
jgi:septal ring factor EnvC (AmiA/AmiB activator)